MEQIITLKVDLEHPDDAKFAIDEAVKAYKADRLKWTEEEIAEAKHLAMKIMEQLCFSSLYFSQVSWQAVQRDSQLRQQVIILRQISFL